ncbi:MAG: hypothetical protein J0L99_05110 [Chitinophagales bacterium]|nr:hypothetical protein [Chitinophagales bacterium]
MMNGIETFRELSPNKLVEDLLVIIGRDLDDFPVSQEFQEVLRLKKNENQHSTAYCLFMTNSCQSRYYFCRENAQKGSSTVDIAVYKGVHVIFVIEAKVLPTPKSTSNKIRNEYEYVYGKGAAIQRFKDLEHGLDNQNIPLADSGVMAFIKNGSINSWYIKINQWIRDATWNDVEQIKMLTQLATSAKLISVHTRKNGSSIRLHHFWIKV